jgi:hypothetical protein
MKTRPMSEAQFRLLLYRCYYLGGEPSEGEFRRAIDWLEAGESGDCRGELEERRRAGESRANVILGSNFGYCFRQSDHDELVGWMENVADPGQMVEFYRLWTKYMLKRVEAVIARARFGHL